ncbi:hypothetical protein EV562_11127 [Streptomyces sp. BK208]|uniref:hypothetical protein n=1 Tax=Streptomyces sp. BK208 TaxID=2512150 RepID=UPI001060339F|nr:hypothetical protein [Streptomyces sp. BK208]TDT31421.1 hypothetical protein EV562_11127 [Streptomyces sp. BK208]
MHETRPTAVRDGHGLGGRKRLREVAALTAAAVALGVAAPLASANAAERSTSAPHTAVSATPAFASLASAPALGARVGPAGSEGLDGLDGLEGLDDEAALAGLEEALRLITEIPDEVLAQGRAATEQWLRDRLGDSSATGGLVQPMKFSAGGCARGILLAVGSNILAIGKIYKVKKAIDKLGGIKKVVKKIQDKKKRGKKSFKKAIMEVFEESGTGIGAIAAEILGVDQVIKHCW